MLQICSRQSNNPFYIRAIDTDVYSLEEINYFIYNHMNLVYRDFFNEKLFDYLKNELGLTEIASRLEQLEAGGASLRDLIMCVFTMSGYYGANDLAAVSDLVTNIDNLSRNERMIIEAEAMMKKKKYASALRIYLDILSSRDEADCSKDQMYARMAFSAGMIYARMFMTKNANTYFSMAYDLYPDPAYAKASVYLSIVSEDDEELLRTIIKYKVSDEALETIRKQIEKAKKQIEESEEFEEFKIKVNEEGGAEKQMAKWKNEYYNMLS